LNVTHTIEHTPRAYSERRPLSTNSLHNGICYFERKPSPILDTSTVFICTLVAHVLYELIDQVSVCAVNFNAIEASPNCIFCGSDIRGNVLFDFIRGECAWNACLSGESDGRGTDVGAIVLFGKNGCFCGTSKRPQL
jgi:hypothetical protein